MLCLWIFASAAEIPLLHVLLPWHAAQVVSIVLGAWGLVWMLGLLASYRVRPHLLDADGLRVRNGPRDRRTRGVGGRRRGPRRPAGPARPRSARSSRGRPRPAPTCRSPCPVRSTCASRCATPVTVRTPAGPVTVAAVSFFVDEPREAVARLREHLARARASAG